MRLSDNLLRGFETMNRTQTRPLFVGLDSRSFAALSRAASIVALVVGLDLIFSLQSGNLSAADQLPAGGHLDPLQTITRFLALTQSGKTSDIRAAARMIEPDRADLAWANDQLDSTSRDMLQTMHVYNFAAILNQDPVVGQPQYALHPRPVSPYTAPNADTASLESTPADGNLDELMTENANAPSASTTEPAPAPVISEEQAERAIVRLQSGRTIKFVKDPAGLWLFDQHSSSLQARAEWVENRDRDLELPPTKLFDTFYLDMREHDPDYAWRVAMALGEAGRFADLGKLIQFPQPAVPPADADFQARAAAEKVRLAKLEEHGRLLYSWLRRSEPRRIRREASHLKLPPALAKDPGTLPTLDGRLANFVIWTTDYKRVRLVAYQRPAPADTIDMGVPVYEWRFDCDCYSPETKRAWIHAQRQSLPDQP